MARELDVAIESEEHGRDSARRRVTHCPQIDTRYLSEPRAGSVRVAEIEV